MNNKVCQKFHSCTDITIGFDPSTYSVTEGAPTVDLVVSVLNGTLDRSVFVTLTLQDGTATGKEAKHVDNTINQIKNSYTSRGLQWNKSNDSGIQSQCYEHHSPCDNRG